MKNNLKMMQQEVVTVSISEEKKVAIVPMEKDVSLPDRKESNTSFLNPAINLARRLSMKITGQRGKMTMVKKIWILRQKLFPFFFDFQMDLKPESN